MKQFDPIKSPLDGKNLIEAAAGTGKTYAVTCLFVRLIIEKGLAVKEILVVTFTVAATEELKDRIRSKLRDALEAFTKGRCDESFLRGLLEKYPDQSDRNRAAERLISTIRDFDEAAIFTIHGFCQRMLYENAFESGALFDVEMVTNQEDLREEIVEDFWRIHFYETLPELVEYAMDQGFSPRYLLGLLDNNAMNPDVRIVPEREPPDIAVVAGALKLFEGKLDRLREIWTASREEITGKLKSESLKANVYGKRVPAMMDAMQGFLISGRQHITLFRDFEKFTQSRISTSVKKGTAPPFHDFFALCNEVVIMAGAVTDLMERQLLFLKTEMILTARREIALRKGLRNIMFYDDLLLKMRTALEGAGGDALAAAIRRKYRSAIIDEFQDTDTIQYAIFSSIFGREGGGLFLIGDPKQTIFDFRGADVFAYMKAASVIETKYALRENWRSEPGLVRAINTLFSHRDKAFVYEGISFQPAEAASGKVHRYLKVEGEGKSPLHLWIVPADGSSAKGLAKGRARSLICRAVSSEIARLLELGREGKATIGAEPIREGHIAVLVRTNREAVLVQKALSETGIPSVLHMKENIFDSREAVEMERLLTGIAHPDREGLVRGALTTDIMGTDGKDLAGFINDENEWRIWLERFWNYHEIWHARGFIRMFRQLLFGEHVKQRLLRYPDGERRLTNVLHLSELLERESIGRRLGPMALLRWLIKQRSAGTVRSDEDQIRLESDENAVKVVTVHKSKGLEYPVVFCPFVWGDSKVKGDILFFHDEHNDWRLTCDVGSSDRLCIEENARREILAENVRLLYVALTRARHRCYLVWGKFNEAGTSAPAYLFHRGGGDSCDDVISGTDERYCGLTDDEFQSDIGDVVRKSGGTIEACEMPTEAMRRYRGRYDTIESAECRRFSRSIDRSWKIASFSYLTSDRPHVADLPDRDTSPQMDISGEGEGATGPQASGILAFPKGARAGSFLHEVMEHMDYTEKNMGAARALVSRKLPEYGFEDKWVDAVVSMLENCVNMPLGRNDDAFRLAAESLGDRINELEFYFPLKRISPDALRSIYGIAGSRFKTDGTRAIPEIMEKLRFSPARGYMKGYMDMVFRYANRFYLVDWKSNFLGAEVTDYNEAALSRTMRESFYFLQYHIYTVALNKFLQLRISDYRYATHFGGVYYLFLRGMDPAWGPDYGIYYDRPEEGLIKALTATLIGVA